jgi:tetratricopeptide (TPR) repeat protein/predicted Ser/Thr protein kinase
MDASQTDSREQRLDEAVAAYLKAREAGQVADRQTWLGRYPDLAGELAEYFADQDRFESLAAPLRVPRPDRPSTANADEPTPGNGLGPAEAPAGAFGDYEVLGEIGRGGMGVVYRARQRGLGRLVALKMVRPGTARPETEAQRFRNEAGMAALLDHPNIVPVHEVGQQGEHLYLSMKLVEGGSLAGRVADFRDDPPAAARLVATLARAMHHAHQRGVLHRDLKPSNILLDAEGRSYVTDFGLAKQPEADSSLTQSGAVVGTPSYMAPEQARGRRAEITTATDVYGLGAVLYALLTGRPPFQGTSVLETLEQVKGQEPEPPRRANRRVSRDLETICLKSLHKEPGRGYGSAEALAVDLERWLNGEPIEARPVGRASRLWRWCRRNPVLSALTAALFVAVVGLAVSTVLVGRAYQAEAAQRQQADANFQAAQEQRRLARQAVDDMYTEFAEKWLAKEAGLTEVQRTFLLKALAFYKELAREQGSDPAVRHDAAKAYARVGGIEAGLGHPAEADAADRQAIALLEGLAAEYPATPAYREHLAAALSNFAQFHRQVGRLPEAEQAHRSALDLREGLARDDPTESRYRSAVGDSFDDLGVVLRQLGRPGDAERAFQHAIEIAEGLKKEYPADAGYRVQVTVGLDRLANLYGSTRRFAEAEAVCRRLLLLLEGLAKDFPRDPEHRQRLALGRITWANVLRETGRRGESEHAYRQALERLDQAAADSPASPDNRRMLASGYGNFGLLLHESGRPEAAEAFYRKALEHYERLVAERPSVPRYQSEPGGTLNNLAGVVRARGEPAEACRLFERAIGYQRGAFEKNPGNPTYRQFLVNHYAGLAETLVRQGRHAEAGGAAREFVRLAPARWFDYQRAADVLSHCALLAEQDGKLPVHERQAAAREYRSEGNACHPEIVKRVGDDPAFLKQVAWFLATRPEPRVRDDAPAVVLARKATEKRPREGGFWSTLGVAQYRAGDWKAAIEALGKSMELSQGSQAAGWFFLAMAQGRLGDPERARRWWDRAVLWMDRNKSQDEELRRFRAEVADVLGIKDPPAPAKEGPPAKGK